MFRCRYNLHRMKGGLRLRFRNISAIDIYSGGVGRRTEVQQLLGKHIWSHIFQMWCWEGYHASKCDAFELKNHQTSLSSTYGYGIWSDNFLTRKPVRNSKQIDERKVQEIETTFCKTIDILEQVRIGKWWFTDKTVDRCSKV